MSATDLCFFDELEEGEYFYLPFHGYECEKASANTFVCGDVESWIGEFKGLWLVARLEQMTCRRCGCTERSACHDDRLDGPCSWARPGLCSACLTQREFDEWLARVGWEEEAA